MKFNQSPPKEIHYHIRVDAGLDRDITRYNIHKSESCREGLKIAIAKAKKKAKK